MLPLSTLSGRQQEIVLAYWKCVNDWAGEVYPPPRPTIRKLMSMTGITSTSVVRYNLRRISHLGVMIHVQHRNTGRYYLNPKYINAIKELAAQRDTEKSYS